VTIVDDELYLTCDETDLQARISSVDIWAAYQESLLSEEALQEGTSKHASLT
jgi:hypothetical protein